MQYVRVRDLPLYHATSDVEFAEFRTDRPPFFFRDWVEAVALRDRLLYENGRARIVHATLTGKVINPMMALEVWNQANPRLLAGTYLYSMLCHETREWPDESIASFEQALRAEGVDGVSYRDYSQQNFDNDAAAICVLNLGSLRIESWGWQP